MERVYELSPKNGRQSFYGKAHVKIDDNGSETLYSYGTPIIKRDKSKLTRLYFEEPSCTTCSHIISFCGLHKKDFMKLN